MRPDRPFYGSCAVCGAAGRLQAKQAGQASVAEVREHRTGRVLFARTRPKADTGWCRDCWTTTYAVAEPARVAAR